VSRPRFRTRRTGDPGQDPHWQDIRSLASWLHSDQFPARGITRQVFASHDKSPPRTTSLRPAREVRSRLVRGPGRTTQAQGASTTTDVCGGTIPHAMQVQQLEAMQAAHPNKSLNAGLTGRAAIPSPSTPTLPHASSARGTRAPSTTRTGLDLGSSVPG
jgi:hypothetical protein